jgi:hypothetical protein
MPLKNIGSLVSGKLIAASVQIIFRDETPRDL